MCGALVLTSLWVQYGAWIVCNGESAAVGGHGAGVWSMEYVVVRVEGATCKQTLSIIEIDRTNSG